MALVTDDRANVVGFAAGGLVISVMAVLATLIGFQVLGGEPAVWDPALAPYVSFVEDTRGHEFDRPVEVRRVDVTEALEISNDEFVASLSAEDLAWFEAWSDTYAILGLIEPGTDLLESESGAVEAAASAYYSLDDGVIYLPEGEVDALLGSIIVHELTHALQHQAGLFELEPWTDDEVLMQRALSEGDADRIERLWVETLSEVEQAEIEAAYAAHELDDTGYFNASAAAPYVLGDPVVESIIELHGQAEIDRLMREGTGSSERLVDALSRTPDPAPAAKRFADELPDGAVSLNGGSLGPVVLYQALAPTVGVDPTLQALWGYDTDTFDLYELDDRRCLRVAIWGDSEADVLEISSMIEALGLDADIGQRGAPKAASVQFDACEPIGSPAAQGFHVLLPLSASHWLTVLHLEDGVGPGEARCAARSQAVTIDVGPGEEIDWDTVVADRAAFLADC